MLNVFIEIVCGGDVALVGGSENWDSIIEEYTDLSKDTTQSEILSLRKEHFRLQNRIDITQEIVQSLQTCYNEGLCDCLRRMGYRIKYSKETLYKDLKQTVSQAKQLVMQRDEVEKQIRDKVGDRQTTRADFDGKLAELSTHQHHYLDEHTTSISRYVAIKNQYQAHIDYLESQTNKPN